MCWVNSGREAGGMKTTHTVDHMCTHTGQTRVREGGRDREGEGGRQGGRERGGEGEREGES